MIAESHLSTHSSQSPRRHQQAADPRRESTVLFKGFSASTAESGLLEVDEIAHINGSPELVTAPQHNTPQTQAQATFPNAALPPEATSDEEAADHQAAFTSGTSEEPQQQGQWQQQQQTESSNLACSRPADSATVGVNPDSSAQPQYEPALDLEHSSPRLQSVQATPGLAADPAAGPGAVNLSRSVLKCNVPLPRQVCTCSAQGHVAHLVVVCVVSEKAADMCNIHMWP